MSTTMKGAYLVTPGRFEIRTVPIPKAGPGEMVIKTDFCGICGSDVRTYQQGIKDGIPEQILGHEFTGTVVETGKGVTSFKVGDPVAAAPDVSCGTCYYCQRGLVNLCESHRMLGTHWPGGFAEYVHIPEFVMQRGMIHKIPTGLSLKAAAMSEPASSVIACQEMVNVGLGDTVLIIGDGPIGCLHMEIARARGASKIIIAGKRRLGTVNQFNPDILIDGASEDIPAKVMDATEGIGADVAIIANRRASSQELGLQSLRKRGVLVLFGGVSSEYPMTSLNSNTIHYREISVIGTFSYSKVVHQQALALINEGKIRPELYYGKEYGLEEIGKAFEEARTGSALKILVSPGER